jgi:hypothetical protein
MQQHLFLQAQLLRLAQLALCRHADLPPRALARLPCAARGQLRLDELVALQQHAAERCADVNDCPLTLTRFSIRIIEYCAYSSLRRPTCLIIASRFSRSLSMRTSIAATHLRVRV